MAQLEVLDPMDPTALPVLTYPTAQQVGWVELQAEVLILRITIHWARKVDPAAPMRKRRHGIIGGGLAGAGSLPPPCHGGRLHLGVE